MAVARAHQHVPVLGRVQAHAGCQPVGREIVVDEGLEVVDRPVRQRHLVSGEGVDIEAAVVGIFRTIADVEPFTGVAVGDEGLVLTPQGLEGTVDVGLEGQLVARMVVTLDAIQRQQAVCADTAPQAARTGQRCILLHRERAPVVHLHVQVPVVVQVVIHLHEGVLLAIAPFVPAHAQEGVTRQAQVAAGGRQRQAVGIGRILLVLQQTTQRHAGAIPEGLVQHPVEQAVVATHVVLEGTVALGHCHHPATDGFLLAERARDIPHTPYRAPAIHLHIQAALRLAGGLLAHGIQSPTRLARPLRETGTAAHHLDALIEGRIQLLLRIHERVTRNARCPDGGADAVFLKLLQVETARLIDRPGAVAGDVDAGGAVERILDGMHALCLHLRLRDDADRLRRLARRQRQPCGGAHRRGGERIRLVHPLDAGHHHRAQLHHGGRRIGRRVVGCHGGQRRRQRQAGQPACQRPTPHPCSSVPVCTGLRCRGLHRVAPCCTRIHKISNLFLV